MLNTIMAFVVALYTQSTPIAPTPKDLPLESVDPASEDLLVVLDEESGPACWIITDGKHAEVCCDFSQWGGDGWHCYPLKNPAG